MEHLLLTLPIPEPKPLLQRIQIALPDLKITYLRHEVAPPEAFYKQDMYIPPEILRETTILMTMGVVPDPIDAPRLRYIHFNVAGIDHVAHKPALRNPNITVTTSTGGSAIAVAEWVFGSILSQARQLPLLKAWQNEKIWGRLGPATPTTSLDGQKLGIIGYGSIGRQVARLAQAFGMHVIVYNSRPRLTATDRKDENWYQPDSGDPDGTIPEAYFHGQSKAELRAFLAQDLSILVLSLPLTTSTKHLIGEEELDIINSSGPAFLVNVSRGAIVDQMALVKSLKKGPTGGGLLAAALDVTEPEPLPQDNELWTLPNVFISPHVSSITPHTTGRAFKILEDNLVREERGQEMINVIKTAEARI